MTLIIHGRKTSSNVQAVMWGLGELGLTADRRDVGGRFGGTDAPEFRAMNPMGLVPVLQDGSLTIFESGAILRYLVQKDSTGALQSSDPLADTWAEWAKHSLASSFTAPVFWQYWRMTEANRDMAAVTRNLRRFEDLAGVALRKRGDGPWIMGKDMTLADIWVGSVLYRYFDLDLPRQSPDGLKTYYDQLIARPAYQRHVMVEYSELKGDMG